jgi:hypothetical protein
MDTSITAITIALTPKSIGKFGLSFRLFFSGKGGAAS